MDGTCRRRVLRLVGTACVGGVAGCTGLGDDPGKESPADDEDTPPDETSDPATWGSYQVNAANTGHATGASGPAAAVTETWTADLGGGVAAPRIAGGRVVAYGGDGQLYALDPASGDTQWQYERPPTPNGRHLGPVATADTVYLPGFVDDSSTVSAVDAADGTERWTTKLDENANSTREGILGPLAVADDTVFVAHLEVVGEGTDPKTEGRVVALNTADGGRAWTTQVKRPQGLAVGDGAVYVHFNDRDRDANANDSKLVVLATDDGNEQSTINVPGPKGGIAVFSAPPAAAGGTVYVAESIDGRLYGFDPATGEVSVEYKPAYEDTLSTPYAPAVANGTLYVTTTRGGLYAVDAASGEVRWTRTDEFNVGFEAAPVVADGVVFALPAGDILMGFDTETGRTLFAHRAKARGAPAVGGGTAFQATASGLTALVEQEGGKTYTPPIEKPPVQFEFDCDDGQFVVTHVGGRTLNEDNTRALKVTVGGDPRAEFDLPVSAGDRVRLSGVGADQIVRVVWVNPEGRSGVLGKTTLQSDCGS